MDWLLAPIDATRTHQVTFEAAWHGRSMVLAWGILAPLAVLVARFGKVLPSQDWPNELDNRFWWRSHWIGHCFVFFLAVFGVGLVFQGSRPTDVHTMLGYSVLLMLFAQMSLGVFRGTKGGPTSQSGDGSFRGDHYDMTPWRIMFEWSHKVIGYILLLLSAVTILSGMWHSNAPIWMWLVMCFWWCGLILLFVFLQRRGYAIDTYQAIWGPDSEHPGNQRKPIGWGIRRVQNNRQPGE